MILWAAHDGGYDADTWYWGALVVLGLLVATVGGGTAVRLERLDGAVIVALGAFALYVAWSYLSITWAGSQGDALKGSNRALLYLVVFALFALTPWTPQRAFGALLAYALGVGAIAALILLELSGHQAAALFSEGRLVSPTGYFNSTAALFTSAALVATGLASRREAPALLRGVLLAIACGNLQLALLGQSRGWLFTLPFVLILAIAIVRDRLRVAAAFLLPVVGALGALGPVLDVFRSTAGAHPSASTFLAAAHRAGRISLLICGGVLIAGSLLARLVNRAAPVVLTRTRRRTIGTLAATLALAAGFAGGLVATHGHPIAFISRQWRGFTHASTASNNTSSHFAAVGTGRYDAWRVSLDVVLHHPIGGLGQDNFADYYVRHRRTGLELAWTHSLEYRLLAHTGFLGLGLFAVFLAACLTAAGRTRRRAEGIAAAMAGIALMPLVVWLIHGSVDWFWEMPALSAPGLAFLAMAAGLGTPDEIKPSLRLRSIRVPRGIALALGASVSLAAVVALGFPYLSVREVSTASDLRVKNPVAALRDLADAARLNPLSADPGRLAGSIALLSGRFFEAETSFKQAISREPGGWFAWLGEGLAASALGDSATARQDYAMAASINSRQPAVTEALARVDTTRPLTPAEAFGRIVLAH